LLLSPALTQPYLRAKVLLLLTDKIGDAGGIDQIEAKVTGSMLYFAMLTI
jgi:hypothetical protein